MTMPKCCICQKTARAEPEVQTVRGWWFFGSAAAWAVVLFAIFIVGWICGWWNPSP